MKNDRFKMSCFVAALMCLLLILPVISSASWRIEAVDAPKYYRNLTSRMLAVDSTGNMHIAYGQDHLYHAYQSGGVWHYETVDPSFSVGQYASIAIDSSDNVHISYFDYTNMTLMYATNASGSWIITSADGNSGVGLYTSIGVDSLGYAHISYYNLSGKTLMYATNASGLWVSETADSASSTGTYSTVVVDPSDNVHIGYCSDGCKTLKYAYKTAGSWNSEVVANGKYGFGDPSLALDLDGNAHMSFWEPFNGILYATNRTGAWISQTLRKGNADSTSIAVDRSNKVHFSYSTYNRLYHATDASGSWTIESVKYDTDYYQSTSTSIAIDPAGNVHIVNSLENRNDPRDDLKHHTNKGGSWTSELVDSSFSVGKYTSIAVDPSDNVHISYFDNSGFYSYGGALRYATNSGGAWSTQVIERKLGMDMENYSYYNDTFIAADSSGNVHISYFNRNQRDLKYATNRYGSWDTRIIDSNVGYQKSFTSLAVDSLDNVHISYADYSGSDWGSLNYATDSSGSWTTETVEDGGGVYHHNLYLYNAITTDSLNRAHISYHSVRVDEGYRGIKYATNSGGAWTIEQAGDSGYIPALYNANSIAVDTSGNIHICYRNTDGDLMYMTNSTGSWVIETVDKSVDLTRFSANSIAVDSHGHVHISYLDANTYDLMYATNSTGTWTTTTVDYQGDVGFYNAIAVDSQDNIHISYYDASNRDLKYAMNNRFDETPPSGVNDLTASDTTFDSVQLAWTAVADDGDSGWHAASYDIRYSTDPVTESGWDSAVSVSGEPLPAMPGTIESFEITGLDPATTYYFAIKVMDHAGHISVLSNIATASTPLPPELSADPLSINVEIEKGASAVYTLSMFNSGGDMLAYNAYVSEGSAPAPVPAVSGVHGLSSKDPEKIRARIRKNIDEGMEYVPGELIVKYRDGTSAKTKAELQKRTKTAKKRSFKKMNMQVWKLSSDDETQMLDTISDIINDPNVEYAEPNYIHQTAGAPDDPRFGRLWGLHNTGQSGGTADADIDAPEAWDIFRGSPEVVVAVIDTGVDYLHEDLADNMWVNAPEKGGTEGIDDDGNGFIDDIYGYDFAYDDPDPMDYYSHGTHCAGTIGAAGNNGTGVSGVNHEVRIMAVQSFNHSGRGTTSDAVQAIIYAVDNGAHILSNSWGGGGYSSSLRDAISYANDHNVLFVAAAGNGYSNNDLRPFYPAGYDLPNVLSVAATDHNDLKAPFSNWGQNSVDLGAPGVSVLSTIPFDGYAYYSGTSMAAPHVSGVAALLKGYRPGLGALDTKTVIMDSVDPAADLAYKTVTGGRLNAANALMRFRPDWISLNGELSDRLQPGSSQQLAVMLDASGKSEGVFYADVTIMSNDPADPVRVIPVIMTVVYHPPIDELCPCGSSWKNHGAYMKCVTHAANEYAREGILTEAERDSIVTTAGESDCGRKKK